MPTRDIRKYRRLRSVSRRDLPMRGSGSTGRGASAQSSRQPDSSVPSRRRAPTDPTLSNLDIRRHLMAEISAVVEGRHLTQSAAGRLFGVAQPRISDIRRGKLSLFTIDTLVNMLAHAGIRARVELEGLNEYRNG